MQLQPEAAKAALQLIRDMKAVAGKGFQASLAKLEFEIGRMTTEIEALRMVGSGGAIEDDKWFRLNMTTAESRFMAALERAGSAGASKDRVMAAIYGDKVGDWPGDRINDIRVFHIRTKLLALNAPYWIETIHGGGWRLHKGKAPKNVEGASSQKRWCRNVCHNRGTKPRNGKPNNLEGIAA